MGHRVFVTSLINQHYLSKLKEHMEVELNPMNRQLTQSEIMQFAKDKDALLCTVSDEINSEVMDACPRLKIISNYGVGYNNIDLEAATSSGVIVTNTPGVLTDATADLTWALLLDVARRVSEGDRLVRFGEWKGWEPGFLLGTEVTGKTLGIIGMGRIGQAVAYRARAFHMNVIYHSRTRLSSEEEQKLGVRWSSFFDLLEEADFVSLHAPYTPETHRLIGRQALKKMKKSAYLINTARGSLVDERALAEALRNQEIAGAALDVYEREPEVPAELKEMENVVLAPHMGSATVETREAMARLAVENLICFFKGKRPPHVVNTRVWEELYG
ncbi:MULTISPECIES: D-glycerate dehydrogenase [Thermoactinomyces]|uniref:D-glycerate dehydrogenase n=1 Tax=Thermoactinomyces vulgaris TaxID=2026 RepID=A0ABS0QGZ5_THEVU|nr:MULTISPECIES: D-glycerate dehydrogenase [Thermoactinomyces]MBA4550756.1 D-glycerate dehydrogenase [Thermoactinomyces vulgaris]MBA4596185.1 D-glycerate dehydrogenase [Thermoactinomyces vulgaris]MBH8583082.1 D-glycerate dehydrogenase [Thermoactinomyces sp. CICC 10735]MBH8585871.1 D-glycerate dehydrogenase [Thermoactinomyces sp. CICC 10520]MBH8588532.1 D-glycerate dehydrogenase [Thermoactinomyces vulgaris]